MSSTKKMTPITKKPEITPSAQSHVQPTQVQPTQSLPKQPILIDLTDEPTPTQQPMTSSTHPIINLNPSMISKPTPSTPTQNSQNSQQQQLTPQQIAMKRFLATQKLLLEKKLIPKWLIIMTHSYDSCFLIKVYHQATSRLFFSWK